MSTWVQQVNGDNVDLETIAANRNTIKVNDVDDGEGSGAAKNALEATNTNTGVSARALKATGMSEITANVNANVDTIGLKVSNASERPGSKTLLVDNLGVRHTSEGNFGTMFIDAINVNDLKIGTNPTNGDIFLGANGKVVTLHGTPLTLLGNVLTSEVNGNDSNLELGTDSNLTHDVVIGSQDVTTSVGPLNVLGNAQVRGDILVGIGIGEQPGHINTRTIGENDPGDLLIGDDDELTNNVVLGHANGDVITTEDLIVQGNLVVGPDDDDGMLDANNNHDLNIGTQASTGDITVGRDGKNLTVNSALIVGGAAATVAKIDAELDGASARKMKIGTQNSTDDITVGRSGKTTNVGGAINVAQTAFVVGETSLAGNLKVGPTANAGTIDSGGVAPSPLNLEVGTGAGTASIVMSRAGQTIDMFGQERLNSNACVLNGAANITAANGIGFVVNAVGHGNGSSIDFYINGQVQGWLDTTGFVNA